MNQRHRKTLEAVFARPVKANIRWSRIEALLEVTGAEIEQRAGSRIAVVFGDEVAIFHRPHPSPDADKGAVAAVRRLLERRGIRPYTKGP